MDTNHWKMMAVAGFAALGGMVWTQVMTPGQAQAYPSGAAVSYGSNPVFSVGGEINLHSAGTTSLSVGKPGYDAVITDVVIVPITGSCANISSIFFETSTDTIASFGVGYGPDSSASPSLTSAHFESGLPVFDGDSLSIRTYISYDACGTTYNTRFAYTISGYYAQP